MKESNYIQNLTVLSSITKAPVLDKDASLLKKNNNKQTTTKQKQKNQQYQFMRKFNFRRNQKFVKLSKITNPYVRVC